MMKDKVVANRNTMIENKYTTKKWILAWALLFLVSYGPIAQNEIRDSQFLLDNWRFQFNDGEEFDKVNFKSSDKWEEVSIPHTWNNKDGQDGGGDYKAGVAWYYKEFSSNNYLPQKDSKNIYIQLDAVNREAEVYLNGKLVGKHVGGYAMFRFKINDYLKRGANMLAVKVRNYGRTEANSIPTRADFTFFGGIYRKVSLFTTDKIQISPLDYAGLGSYVKQKQVSQNIADLEVKTIINNDYDKSKKVEVKVSVMDKDGKLVVSVNEDYAINKNSSEISTLSLKIDNPHLWQGIEDPYLYTVNTDIYSDGKLVDRVTQRLGLRYYGVDPDKGFFLNGKHLKLRGVNKHQDRLDKGWAISDDDMIEDMNIIREMGVNTVRFAHYQHDQKVYEICDELGIIVWAEIPYVDYMRDNKVFFDNAKQQLSELIRQNFHHSSILFWSIGNETKADQQNEAPSIKLLNVLQDHAKKEDDSRLSIYAHNGSPSDEKVYVSDLFAWNRYMGWYSGAPQAIDNALDTFHRDNPTRAIALSEYGAGGSVVQHTENFAEKVAPRGDFHPEEYQSYYHEIYLNAIESRHFVYACWLWNMFDFAADQRSEGDTSGRNDKGLVTYDRKTKKDVFYLYKATWSTEPTLYITSRRFIERKQKDTYIKVYSNCEQVEAFVNGKSLGILKGQNNMFLWENVELQNGENKIEVKGVLNGKTYTDLCTWEWNGVEKAQVIRKSAEGGLVQASAFQEGNEPKMAYDDNPETRWAVNGLDEWLQIDFDGKETIKGLEITFDRTKGRVYTIDIEASEDGPFWEKVVADGKSIADIAGAITFKFNTPVTVQYVRIYNKGNDKNKWLSISEINVIK